MAIYKSIGFALLVILEVFLLICFSKVPMEQGTDITMSDMIGSYVSGLMGVEYPTEVEISKRKFEVSKDPMTIKVVTTSRGPNGISIRCDNFTYELEKGGLSMHTQGSITTLSEGVAAGLTFIAIILALFLLTLELLIAPVRTSVKRIDLIQESKEKVKSSEQTN